ncbi:MAG: hypothetical protein RLY66_406 [Candidatus Parcubacteria bacterium]|jgi:hypothetical protein
MSSGVEFDEDSLKYARHIPAAGGFQQTQQQYSFPGQQMGGNEPKMIQWLMKKGIVKSPNMGQAILIGMVIINIIITFVVIKYFL